MKVGDVLVATNRGGEIHTSTEVEEFGGGVVDQLNQLTGLTEVAPECAALAGGGKMAPGGIHPWMRTEVRISESETGLVPLGRGGANPSQAANLSKNAATHVSPTMS